MLFCPNRFISLIAVFDHLNYIYFYISKIYLKNRWLLFRVVLCKSTLFVCHAIYFWPNRFAQRLIPILIRVILSSGFKGGGRLPVPSGIRPPADPKGPPGLTKMCNHASHHAWFHGSHGKLPTYFYVKITHFPCMTRRMIPLFLKYGGLQIGQY